MGLEGLPSLTWGALSTCTMSSCILVPLEAQAICCAVQDELIEQLGGVDKVAELTGRRKRMVKDDDTGAYCYQLRAQHCALDQVSSYLTGVGG